MHVSCTSLLAVCSPPLDAYLSFTQQIPSSTPGEDDRHQAADTQRSAAAVHLSADDTYIRRVAVVVCLVRICLSGQVTSCEGALPVVGPACLPVGAFGCSCFGSIWLLFRSLLFAFSETGLHPLPWLPAGRS